MKKLMMALVAVAFGCAAQAATVSWSTTKITEVADASGAMGGANCGTAYTAILTIYGDSGTKITSTGSGWSLGKVKATDVTSGSLTLGAKGYTYELVISGTVTSSGKNYSEAIGKEATLTYSGTFNMGAQGETTLSISPTGATWVVAPEPTSGLLLLLGMAGLALKRKQK